MDNCCAMGTIIQNKALTDSIYELKLTYQQKLDFIPGQFVNLKLDGFYLRRPISVADYDDHTLTLIYKVVGQGTDALSKYPLGQTIDTLMPLGNGFDLSKPIDTLIGGGMGIAPIYGLTKALKDHHPLTVILGFRNKDEIVYLQQFQSLGVKMIITTDDGSYGIQGNVMAGIDTFDHPIQTWAACGPTIMMKSLSQTLNTHGQVSLEARMGCGFGGCMGCSIQTTSNQSKRVCLDGPVFDDKEVLWDSLK